MEKRDKEIYRYVTEHCPYCALCGSTSFLHRHHIIYRSEGGPTDYWNIIVLCERCHRMVHSNKRKWQPRLQKILREVIVEECGYDEDIKQYVRSVPIKTVLKG